jgi:hypothetical protein
MAQLGETTASHSTFGCGLLNANLERLALPESLVPLSEPELSDRRVHDGVIDELDL